jgi:hypothetical protein
MNTRLSHTCDRLIEAGWLLAVVLTPIFFNVHTARVFEPDKALLVRGIAIAMAAAWLVKVTEGAVRWLGGRLGWIEWDRPSWPRRSWLSRALIALSALYAAVYLVSTLTSVYPRLSLMGSYQRGHGTLLTLGLIVIALLLATHLRTPRQAGRLLASVAVGSVPVTIYAVVQHAGADPLPWGSPDPVVVSTQGNANFLAAYLAMAIPLTIVGLLAIIWAAVRTLRERGEELRARFSAPAVVGFGLLLVCGLVVLGLQGYALALAGARIPSLSLLAAAVPTILLLVAILPRRSQERRALTALAGFLILGVLLALTVVSLADVPLAGMPIARLAEPTRSPVLIVRQLIWDGARELLFSRPDVGGQPDRWSRLRPLLGYGPETMALTYNPVYRPDLGRYESPHATPDRAFNQLLDVGVNLGWAGVVAFLLLVAAFCGTTVEAILASRGTFRTLVAAGVLWAGLAHVVEAQFGVPTVSARLLFWVGIGVAAGPAVYRETEVAGEDGEASPAAALWDSGVAVLLLPTAAIVATAIAGFLHVVREGVGLGAVMVAGLVLAAAAAAVDVVVRRGPAPEGAERGWRFHLVARSVLGVLALALLVAAGLFVRGLMAGATEPWTGPHDWDAILGQTRVFPLLAWSAAGIGLVVVGLALPCPDTAPAARDRRGAILSAIGSPLYALIAVGAAMFIVAACVRPMQADAVFKMSSPYSRPGSWVLATQLIEQAVELAPQEDFYYIFLGRAQLEQAQAEDEPVQRASWLAQALETLERARALNPLNPDHAANLARFHSRAADLEADSAAREVHLQAADGHYAQTTVLAPRRVVLLNEWAAFRWHAWRDEAQTCNLLERSLELDPEFEQTQRQYAEVCWREFPDQPQNLDFEE